MDTLAFDTPRIDQRLDVRCRIRPKRSQHVEELPFVRRIENHRVKRRDCMQPDSPQH